MMRPRTVILAETLFLASLLLVLVGTAITWHVAVGTLGLGAAIVSVVVVVLVSLVLLLLATRRRSRVALWLLTAWTLFSAWSVARQVVQGTAFTPAAAVTVLQIVLMIATVVLLFARPSRAWFGGAAGRSEYRA